MNTHLSRVSSRLSRVSPKWLWLAGGGLLTVAALVAMPRWMPWFKSMAGTLTGAEAGEPEDAADPHAGHDHGDHSGHDHAGHEESESIEISEQARRNIGLKTGEIRLGEYARKITVPAIVAARPGETNHTISAPLTGVVTNVYIVGGETVRSGQPLFDLRLTHEDLVAAQTEFLTTLARLDVERRELRRVESITSGAIPRKTVLERQYEVDKLEAELKAEQNALRLHGLDEEQIDRIVQGRELVREVQVTVPYLHEDASVHYDGEEFGLRAVSTAGGGGSGGGHELVPQRFVVQELGVQSGEAVQTGQTLCVVSDLSRLYAVGQAFEKDAGQILGAADAGSRVTAMVGSSPSSSGEVGGLEIAFVANEVDRESRILHFYVDLPNEVVRRTDRGEHEFVTWRFKPGQRMQLRVPVETWKDVIVVPVDAVAQEGPESFVFVENGDHFDRRPVHVLYRDQFDAVLANDGSLFPGESVALGAAHQLQMALKNKAAGPVDPHAGHTH